MCVYIYIYISRRHIFVHIYMCICIYIHTHTQGDPGREHVLWLHDEDVTNAETFEHFGNSENSEKFAKCEDGAVVLEKFGFREYVPLLSLSCEVFSFFSFFHKKWGQYFPNVKELLT